MLSFTVESTVLENFSHNLSNESNNFVSGLLMTKRINTWDVCSYLKLSAVLEMYYSEYGIHRDTRFRGCNRLNNYRDPTLIDQPQLKEQVNLLTSINRRWYIYKHFNMWQSLNTALIMYSRGIDGAPTFVSGVQPVDKIGQYVNATIDYIERHIGK